jgi:hypothetical protein
VKKLNGEHGLFFTGFLLMSHTLQGIFSSPLTSLYFFRVQTKPGQRNRGCERHERYGSAQAEPIEGYDYSQNGVYFLYFVTVCTKDRAELSCGIEPAQPPPNVGAVSKIIGHLIIPRRGVREHRASCLGYPPEGGDSVEEKIKLVIAVLQLLLVLAELIRILSTYF